ncbi:MAG: hypothetical protein KGJ07_09620 [Patescibacteria group bacterium]|nr:hypothetical protein [Patescibacteria group bacterium]
MTKFLCTAESVDYLGEEIEAKTEEEALQIFNEHLENGAVPVDRSIGSIENVEAQSLEE